MRKAVDNFSGKPASFTFGMSLFVDDFSYRWIDSSAWVASDRLCFLAVN